MHWHHMKNATHACNKWHPLLLVWCCVVCCRSLCLPSPYNPNLKRFLPIIPTISFPPSISPALPSPYNKAIPLSHAISQEILSHLYSQVVASRTDSVAGNTCMRFLYSSLQLHNLSALSSTRPEQHSMPQNLRYNCLTPL